MTNETTASQPTDFRKVLVAVRESLQFANDSPNGGINDTIWMMHGPAPETVFDFIDAALDGEPSTPQKTADLFASQPKSIGDDAQFRNLLFAYLNVGTTRQQHDVYSKIIAHIDSRAPAAQASATIQAAPDTGKLLRYGCMLTPGDQAYMSPERYGEYVKLSDVEALLAATIQEPVMVAEPVGDCEKCEGGTIYNTEHTRCAPCPFCKSAAPMVADPAGVESLRASFESWCIRNNFSTNKWPDGVYLVSETVGAWEGWQAALSATVKAVPSEAMDTARLNWIIDCAFLTTIPYGRNFHRVEITFDQAGEIDLGDARLEVRAAIDAANFAAPLADKTGGGECTVPPPGWYCSRGAGHEGPCAASATNGGE